MITFMVYINPYQCYTLLLKIFSSSLYSLTFQASTLCLSHGEKSQISVIILKIQPCFSWLVSTPLFLTEINPLPACGTNKHSTCVLMQGLRELSCTTKQTASHNLHTNCTKTTVWFQLQMYGFLFLNIKTCL